MFEGFAQGSDSGSRRRFTLSTIASLALYAGAAGALAAAAANAPPPAELVKKVQVTFRPPPPPAAPEPPPPPPRRAPPPPVPKKLKTIEVAGLPPPPPLVAPKEIPLEAPPEAEPTDAPIAVAPASEFSGYGGAGAGSGPAARRAPVHLPEAATPPVAASSNVPPVYPEAARQRGQESQVVLKIVIDEDGGVGRVEVLRGDEPFASAAISAVRRWRYQPATLDGIPISIFRIVKVPFRID